MPPGIEFIIGLPSFKINSITRSKFIEIRVDYVGEYACPYCECRSLRNKGQRERRIKHQTMGLELCELIINVYKFVCYGCKRYFHQRLPGVLPRFRSSEPLRAEVAKKHLWGFTKKKSSELFWMSHSTVERCVRHYLKTKDKHRAGGACPKVLGIDEKFFTKKKGYLTTFCDLKRHKVFDITLGRSEKSLAPYLAKLSNKQNCRVIVMDLSETYRSIAKKHFGHALIVADRFHVVKLINHHFLRTWADLDEVGRKNRGLLSLMRRHAKNLKPEQVINLRKYLQQHPAIEAVYDFKQSFMSLILSRVSNRSLAKKLIPQFLNAIEQLKSSGFKHLVTLGNTIDSWQEEIVRMWRFSKTNSITEGLHNKMEVELRRAYGMRNFDNYRIRVLEMCS